MSGQELIQHHNIHSGHIHKITNWRFPDTATRLSTENQFVGADVDKVCYDIETELYYILQSINTSTGEPNWKEIPSSITDVGEANTASSVGGGVSIVAGKLGVDLQFKSLFANGASFAVTSESITIDVEPGATGWGDIFGSISSQTDLWTILLAKADLDEVALVDHTHALATGSIAGFLSAAGFTKLDGLETNATHSGDVVGSTVLTIQPQAVTYAKIQLVTAGSKLLGRGDSGTGEVEEITLGSGLTMTGTVLSMSTAGIGDMLKSTYDVAGNGVVDNSELLEGNTSAYHLARANHTGSQLSTTISDFTEAAQDAVFASFVNGTNITITYNDVANTITISSTSFEPILAAGTAGQYYRGDKTWQTLNSTAVGLANVDNTSDIVKNAAAVTLTNKTIDGGANTLQNIPQGAVLLDADLLAIAALASAADKLPYAIGAQTWALTTFTAFARTLLDDVAASDSRTTLGLGSIATQNSNSVAVTGGTVDNTTLGATTPTTAKVTSLDVSLDLNFSGASKLIKGDFSSASNLRTSFQTNVANGVTQVAALPLGSGTTGGYIGYNAADPLNAAFALIRCTSAAMQLTAGANGTGVQLPISIITNSTSAIDISTAQNVGFGVASPNTDCKLQVSNGIKVGNAANSVTTVFDWYEEGTFTPTIIGIGAAGVGTYTKQVGTYQRRGNRVDFQITLGWSAHTGTGQIVATGLPFTAVGTTNDLATCSIFTDGMVYTAGKTLQTILQPSAVGIRITERNPVLGANDAHNVDATCTTLSLTGSYEV